jgi:hypothetical protein
MNAIDTANMKRSELVRAAAERFQGKCEAALWLRCTNDELRAALESGLLPAKMENGYTGGAGGSVNMAGAVVRDLVLNEPKSTGAVDAVTVKESAFPIQAGGNGGNGEDLADSIARAIGGKVKAGVDAAAVREIALEVVESATEKRFAELARDLESMAASKHREIVVSLPDGTSHNVGRAHKSFDRVLSRLVACGRVWMAGPAGCGKTTIAHQCATALGLEFEFNGAIDSPYKLQGFIDAQGRIVRPAFRKAYENGGVYLFDEVDASMPAAVLAFNAALSNGHADFPDGRVTQHEKFYCIAAANTWGHGATNSYVGRLKQDSAFLDRFVKVAIDYDEDLERDLCKAITGNDAWACKVQEWRANARRNGLQVVVSPRATIFGAKLLAAGVPEKEAIEDAVSSGMSAEQWSTIK